MDQENGGAGRESGSGNGLGIGPAESAGEVRTAGEEKGGHQPRNRFSGRLAFVLAASASAVGLGNVWRFPYLAAKYGGGAFLLVYLLLVFTFGFTLMVAEIALGRKSQRSVAGAYSHYGRKFAFIGVLSALVPFIITPYYCVIGGWVTRYTVDYLTDGAQTLATSGYFTSFITGPYSTFLWFFLFLGFTIAVVALGIRNGIEKSNKVLMPLLIAIGIGISIYACALPGGLDGLAYFFIPDFSKFSIELVVAAMGQMFFSLSLAMGIMVTYGSYFGPEESIEGSTRRVEMFDTLIAILAGLMIIPAIFAVSGDGTAVATNAGPSLMFVVLPQTFANLGDIPGMILGFAFFLLVLFAALTSSISLFETCTSIVVDYLHCSRVKAIVGCSVFMVVMGIIVNLGYNAWIGVDPMYTIFGIGEQGSHQILDFFDFISNTIMMPIVALLTCLFIGWVVKPETIIEEVESSGHRFKAKRLFIVMIRYVCPVFIVMILVGYVLSTVGVITL